MAGLAKPTIGISSENVIGRSSGGAMSQMVLEDNYAHFMAEMDKQLAAGLEKGADPVVEATKAHETRVKTGAMRGSIKKGRVQRLQSDSIAVQVITEDFKGLFHDQGTLGNYKKNRKMSKSHSAHVERASTRTRTRKTKADGSVNRKYKRATYKRSSTALKVSKTKKGLSIKNVEKKHGIKPLNFMKKGLKSGWDSAVDQITGELSS